MPAMLIRIVSVLVRDISCVSGGHLVSMLVRVLDLGVGEGLQVSVMLKDISCPFC